MYTYDRTASNRTASLSMGETFENEEWRVHRFRPSLKVTSLVGAGKRGAKVEEFTLYSSFGEMTDEMADAVLRAAKAKVGVSQMAQLMKDLGEKNDFGFEARSLKGVEVKPGGFQKLKIVGDHITVEADYDSFSVEDTDDHNNIPTCIARGKKSIFTFYRWVRDNQAAIKRMTMSQAMSAMKAAGVDYHYFCAMD